MQPVCPLLRAVVREHNVNLCPFSYAVPLIDSNNQHYPLRAPCLILHTAPYLILFQGGTYKWQDSRVSDHTVQSKQLSRSHTVRASKYSDYTDDAHRFIAAWSKWFCLHPITRWAFS